MSTKLIPPAVTPGEWYRDTVSDAVRVCVPASPSRKRQIILARLAPPQLPETETFANGLLMSQAKKLAEALEALYEACTDADSRADLDDAITGAMLDAGRAALLAAGYTEGK